MLSNLIANLSQIEYEHIRLMAPISIVDALSIERYKDEFPEIYKNQIEYADTVIFSKTENLADKEKDKLKLEVSEINPNCKIITEHYSTLPDSFLDSLLHASKAYLRFAMIHEHLTCWLPEPNNNSQIQASFLSRNEPDDECTDDHIR